MGIDSRRAPPLPAPTETETNTPTELTVDAIKPSDGKSTVSIPEDGTPVTISTRHKANKSQTSLLIEYFEGGKTSPATGERRPSVRVRLTPSKKGRGDHIQVTKGTRKASLTKRIPLDQLRTDSDFGEDANSMSSYASATEESNVSRHPIEVDIDRSHRRRRPASPLIPTSESYPHVNPSQISEIPSDSFLDGTGNATDQKGSFSTPRGENLATAAVAGAAAGAAMNEISNYKSRTGKKERVKLSDKSKEPSDRGRERKHRSKSRTSSVSERTTEDVKTPRRRSSRGHQESTISAADSSVLSSNMTPSHRSGDTHSTRSGVSKSSINNPKLLETVEDAIRRLILPELSALKREQSKRESRRSSFTSSNTTTSKEDVSTDRRRSSGQRSDSKRNREARHDYGDSSPLSVSRESFHDGYDYDTDPTTPKQSGLLKAAAAGAAGAAVGKGLSSGHDDKPQSEERKQRERRRRRTESARSRSLGRERYADEYEDDLTVPAPPMPLMSELNASELTRTSILSADTDRPHSASEEMTPIQHVSRGLMSPDSTPTPTRTPTNLDDSFTQHANVSHGDLTALPRGEKKPEEYEEDEFGNKTTISHDQYDDDQDVSDPDDYPDNSYEATYFATQEVPPPLKYVPYQAGARGLSPIPSVSGYTEGGSEYQPRHSRSMHSTSDVYSGIEKSPEHRRSSRSTASLNSLRGHDRDFDGASQRSSGIDYRNTAYTDDSELDRVMTGQAVRGVGANPNFVHPPMGVESNVASLIDGSMLDQSVLTSQSGYNSYHGARDSTLSYDDQSRVSQSSRGISPEKRYGGLRDSEISYDELSKVSQSSRGVSPDKRSIDSRREIGEERHSTPGGRSHKQSQEFSEYELDEHGRKVAARARSPTASEAAITAGAVGAAAAALRAAKEQRHPILEEEEEYLEGQEEYVPAGVFRNKSFKERTLEGHEPRNTPAHSIDRLSFDEPPKMSATGIPDWNNPMPEYEYYDDDLQTNPSIIQERLDGERMDIDESGRSTPTQKDIGGHQHGNVHTKDGGLGITETAAVATLGAAAGMAAAHAHSREPSHDHDEWQRTSDEKKRDTLVTNPYEDASPIANPGLNENLLNRGLNPSYGVGYHTGSPGFGQSSPGFAQKYDEGYMSNGPNRTPDADIKGKGLDLTTPANGEDPFYVPKDRHYSGLSQGMASPFYDAATGQGIERIENKDIVALMQHLMVRDAQRSARDTEIVALLMNAALEMRTSFQEMKGLIQDTGDDVIFAGVENTEKLTKAINGPRPYPGTRSSIQSASQLDTLTDAATKKKNFLKRALQGLSAKGTSDLSRIEDMLMQLLGEVDVLKTQTAPPASTPGRSPSLTNLQPEGQYEHDRGYEPEGNSTASHASQSGHLSLNQSRNPSFRLTGERKFSDHRISTVQENEEEYEFDHPSPSMERTNANLLTPGRADIPRGGSVPLDTPPQHSGVFQQPLSAENTPRTEKAKKHKSGNSTSWLPKFSRWSGTTSSSVGKAFKKKEIKYDDYAPSRSVSSLASYNDDLYEHNPYEEDKLHAGFSEQNLDAPSQPQTQAGASKRDPLTGDDPKYKAHRNSLNLQHPQPRPGQTERFRNALEHSAQEYDNPMTPRSTDWAGSATSVNRLPTNANRYSNASSTGAPQQQQQEYWESSPTGPPRPPKEPIESPSARTPPRSNRVSRLAKSSPLHQTEESTYAATSGTHPAYTSSPKPENRNLNAALGLPTRRPSGPRSMTPKSPEQDARDERRRKRDTFGTIGSHHTDDTDTF